MAQDFERDLRRDNLPPEKIQAQLKCSRERITSAPAAILLCLDMSEMDSYPDEKRNKAEYMMAVQSTAAAGMQLLLAAHAEGLGGGCISCSCEDVPYHGNWNRVRFEAVD